MESQKAASVVTWLERTVPYFVILNCRAWVCNVRRRVGVTLVHRVADDESYSKLMTK